MDWFLSSMHNEWSDGSISEGSSPNDDEEEYEEDWRFQAESLKKPKSKARSDKGGSIDVILQPSQRIAMHGLIQATCSQFSVDGNWLAVGIKSGIVQIHSAADGRLAVTLDMGNRGFRRSPCTALCIRPSNPGDSSYNVLLSCDLSGQIHYWHMTSGMHLGISKEPQNNIYSIDFQPTGFKYATAGSDFKVRIYDAATRNLLQILQDGNGMTTAGHSNRVFAVKWHPLDVHITLSGGWDNTIQVWDTRTSSSVRSIFGPRICGDSLDVSGTGDLILTGSWRDSHQLQEWDFGSGRLLRDFYWQQTGEQPCRLYAAKYGKGISKMLLGAGGSGSNETCLFSLHTGQVAWRLSEVRKATYSVAFSPDGSLFLVTTPEGVNIFDINAIASETLAQL